MDTIIMLRRCEEINQALRLRLLPTSGLKEEIATRLAHELATRVRGAGGPRVRQLKYVLF